MTEIVSISPYNNYRIKSSGNKDFNKQDENKEASIHKIKDTAIGRDNSPSNKENFNSSTIKNSNINSSRMILARDSINRSPGHGLWCVNTDGKSGDTSEINELIAHRQKIQKKEEINNLNNNLEWLEMDNALEIMDKKIIKQLKEKIVTLTNQLQKAWLIQNELEYKTKRAEERTEMFKEITEKKMEEIEGLKSSIMEFNDVIDKLNQTLLVSKDEIKRHKDQIEKLNEIIKNEKKINEELMEDFKQKEEMYSEENKTLLNQLQKISTSHEESGNINDSTGIGGSLKSKEISINKQQLNDLNKKNLDNTNNTNRTSNKKINKGHLPPVKTVDNNSSENLTKNPLDSNEFKMSLMIVDLRERVSNMESQNQLQYLNMKKKKEENSQLKKTIESYKTQVEELKGQIRIRDSGIFSKRIENEFLKGKLKTVIEDKETVKNDKINFYNSVNNFQNGNSPTELQHEFVSKVNSSNTINQLSEQLSKVGIKSCLKNKRTSLNSLRGLNHRYLNTEM